MSAVDPAGHVKLAVINFKNSFAFYVKLLKKLGYEKIAQDSDSAGWTSPIGFGMREALTLLFFLRQLFCHQFQMQLQMYQSHP